MKITVLFFLLTNDTEFEKVPTIKILLEILEEHNKVGILSPCSKRWGEKLLLEDEPTKYFWFIHNNSYLIRRTFIEDIFDKGSATIMSFLFDGSNFRGYCNEHELIAKAYVNDWAAAITSKVWTQENEGYLLDYADQIKTEKYEENLKLYVAEGKAWLRKKYGFKSKWSMVQYVKSFYDEFFQFNPELNKYKL